MTTTLAARIQAAAQRVAFYSRNGLIAEAAAARNNLRTLRALASERSVFKAEHHATQVQPF